MENADSFSFNGSERTAPGQVTQFITISRNKALTMSEDEREDTFFNPQNINSKETLAPLYIRDLMLKEKGRRWKPSELMSVLRDCPYNLGLNINAIRRVLNTLVYNEENIYRIQDGHDFYYLAADEVPEGYVTEMDELLETTDSFNVD